MSKPDWKDAPEWASYLAQDKNGTWWWYDREPIAEQSQWESCGIAESACVCDDWKESLQKRPKE